MIAHQETMTTIGNGDADVSETENGIATETGTGIGDTIMEVTSMGPLTIGKSEIVPHGTGTWTWINQQSSMTLTCTGPFTAPAATILCFNGPSPLPQHQTTTSLAHPVWISLCQLLPPLPMDHHLSQ